MKSYSAGSAFSEPARSIISCIRKRVREEFPSDRFVPLLIGSFARNEQTAVRVSPGNWIILGDVEIFIVATTSDITMDRSKRLKKVQEVAEVDLDASGIRCKVDIGFIDVRHIRSPANTIFWAEVLDNGLLLGSDIFQIAPITWPGLHRRGPIDAFNLLGNRAVELLHALASSNGHIETVREVTSFRTVKYPLLKSIVDSYTALTVMCNHFKPSYLERLESIEVIRRIVVPSCFSQEEWEQYSRLVAECTRLKCQTFDNEKELLETFRKIFPGTDEDFVKQAITCLQRIARLCDPRTGTAKLEEGQRPCIETHEDFLREFPPAFRPDFRDWMKVFWMHYRSYRSLPTLGGWRNFFRGSPRALVYAMAFYLLERRRIEGTLDGESTTAFLGYLPTNESRPEEAGRNIPTNRFLAFQVVRNWEMYIKNG